MGQNYIFTIESLTKIHDETEVLSDVWLAFYPGAKIGVLGKNGTGKSTLLRIMSGDDKDFMGKAEPAKGVKIGFFHQEPKLNPDQTVEESIAEGVAEANAILERFNEINMKLGEEMSPEEMEALLEEQAVVQDKIDTANLWEIDRTVDIAKDALRVPPDDAVIGNLSGGEKRRVALCRLLLESPDILLLDEPTNHLDAESVLWLEKYLENFAGTVVAVTHDRYFLDNVAQWILELDKGKAFPFEGNYSGWLKQKAARIKVEEKRQSKRDRMLKQELDWINTSPKARGTKNRARIQRYEEMRNEQFDTRDDDTVIQIAPGPELGTLVVDCEHVTKAFGDKLLYEDLTFRLPRGGIIGVIGPNGAGKTTLFKMIMGLEEPDSGTLRVGDTVKLAYVDQSRDTLDPDKTVYEEISGGTDFIELGGHKLHTRAYCNRFNFKGTDQQVKVGVLSGGERNRVHLAKVLRSGGNLILLDEPTNDLDVDTLRSLEEGLSNFAGCVMVSSHDRYFLDRVATHILAFEGDSQVYWHEGNFDSYEANKHERLGAEADQPHRIRFKNFSRS
ncbi:energy-dependent translational throttle protein EttA [Stratiformator vulcanicus]|uniref:Energy-dependent translational throttle protein EttA n=1 Tax=Stratiformator vulcanicus TaxID=2527980 RepID=A0A517QY73_9PLAN|nr:energy-dependent translational throttle protein EttA [Stratiformator vulcanicus]QDT36500.1 putative ABC transporter ATP-binding protein [Stratiformator vulcanicus]